MRWNKYILQIIFTVLLSLTVANTSFAQNATTTDVLKNKIDERNNQIKQLEAEIKQYNREVETAGKQAQTLQSTLRTLDLTKKKITTDISLTENRISKTTLTIEQLDDEISSTKTKIDANKQAIRDALKNRQYLDGTNFVSMILSKRSLGDIWGDIDDIEQVREAIRMKTIELDSLKTNMEFKQDDLKGQKTNLITLKQDLSGKKQAVEYTVQEKAVILVQTKNKEQTYKELLKTKQQQRDQYLKELFDYESQLKYLIDPTSYPQGKPSILAWPLDNVFITQRFGRTVGASRLYRSGSHNGVDFRASVGTRVKNVLAGTVVGTGDTDKYPGCYSFGRWVMVRHENGLSTIYAHLSVISVNNGQNLGTGDTIGFSGNTGYSTGPHLHVSVYATQGVRIEKFVNSRGCKEAVIPLADIRAYLDPMEYFPTI